MEDEKKDKDIEIEYVKENDELVLALSYDGILYIQKILEELQKSEIDSHWHIDDFSGWLGGNIKHLIIIRKD